MEIINKAISNEFVEFWIQDDIIFGNYVRGVEIDIIAAKKIVADRIKLCGSKNYPHLINICGIKSSTKDARDYL